MGLGEWDEQVIDEMLDDRDDDGVAHGVVGLVVGFGQLVESRGSHEGRSLAGGDLAGRPFSGVVEEEELAAAPAFGRAQATGKVVETKLQNLFAVAGPTVAGKNSSAGWRNLVQQLLMSGRDEGE